MSNPTEGAPKVGVEVYLDPDGVNGDIHAVMSGEPAEVRVTVYRGPEQEVIFDNGLARFHVNVRTLMETDVFLDAEDEEDAESRVKTMFEENQVAWPVRAEALNDDGSTTSWSLVSEFDDVFFVEESA